MKLSIDCIEFLRKEIPDSLGKKSELIKFWWCRLPFNKNIVVIFKGSGNSSSGITSDYKSLSLNRREFYNVKISSVTPP